MDPCKRFRKFLSLYIEKEIPKEKEEEFRKHLDECISCQDDVSVQSKIMDSIHHLHSVKTSEDFDSILRTRIRIESGLDRRRLRGATWGWPARIPVYGMSLALIVIAALMVTQQFKKMNQPEVPDAFINTEWYGGNPEQNRNPLNIREDDNTIVLIENEPASESRDSERKARADSTDMTDEDSLNTPNRLVMPVNQVVTY
ncbi:MAG: zf-HC2 domain-containing protein [candidate division KSB1 bacterium]|jgi:hypothetical protein|nr:zf-HC2 domain-containing protein [candidate division KSB1 bacterium]